MSAQMVTLVAVATCLEIVDNHCSASTKALEQGSMRQTIKADLSNMKSVVVFAVFGDLDRVMYSLSVVVIEITKNDSFSSI